ncbi:5'-nucleotidase domain-containing protein 2-like isoform X2 [Rhineura floridana]|uniref:5'-nucleotidase domain-containing protein 2-like isoform X2 n=1 Tax=Rhineura floridana TaxID=261503 RepID=UPI002AC853F9|nr:5'-nucleotidase domain-containing protein 2-like isoform X2 [Rhineura floridana]
MVGASVRAGLQLRPAVFSAPYCTRFGTEAFGVAAAAAGGPAPQPGPPYGSRKPHARQVVGAPAADADPAARDFSSSATAPGVDNKSFLWARYGEMKRLVQDLLPPGVCNLLNPSTIYSNNEISLSNIGVYGFDYDYTLALYSPALHSCIYNTARDILVEQYKYPKGILKYEYWPNFAIRGLHYDIAKGLLMKIDAFHYIQLGTVYRGLKPVPDDEVLEMYDGTHHIPLHQASGFYGKGPAIKQFMDIFSLPEMTLLAVANDFFISNDIDYDPIHLYKDVTDAIRDVHIKGFMYKWIMQDLEKYILRGDETYAVLHRLANSGKKLFLITNSPFSFVDKGMRYMVGKNWRDFFDVVIVQADKPHFFNDCVKPFRRLDSNGDLQWDKINKLEKGQVYKQGNLFDFLRLTGWRGSKVLYFGDHLYSDLADLMLRHGWRTGAIVPELETETKMVNTEQYSQALTWLQALTGLLERMQMFKDPESQQVLQDWMKERQELSFSSDYSSPQKNPSCSGSAFLGPRTSSASSRLYTKYWIQPKVAELGSR